MFNVTAIVVDPNTNSDLNRMKSCLIRGRFGLGRGSCSTCIKGTNAHV